LSHAFPPFVQGATRYKGKEGKVGNDKTLNTIVIVIIEQYEKYVKICHDVKVKINHKL
jgi:hypothetical protein